MDETKLKKLQKACVTLFLAVWGGTLIAAASGAVLPPALKLASALAFGAAIAVWIWAYMRLKRLYLEQSRGKRRK